MDGGALARGATWRRRTMPLEVAVCRRGEACRHRVQCGRELRRRNVMSCECFTSCVQSSNFSEAFRAVGAKGWTIMTTMVVFGGGEHGNGIRMLGLDGLVAAFCVCSFSLLWSIPNVHGFSLGICCLFTRCPHLRSYSTVYARYRCVGVCTGARSRGTLCRPSVLTSR